MSAPHVTELTVENFEGFIQAANKPVLVDFHADWCGPCQSIEPLVEEIADETLGTAVIAKLNVDEAPAITARYGIRSIPTFIVFKGGKPVRTLRGVSSKAALLAALGAA